jgi:hypothetical protein
MLHLLTETSIFVSLPNQCLCQLTGEPLIHIIPSNSGIMVQKSESQGVQAPSIIARLATKRKASGQHEDERPPKRLRIYESVSTTGNAGTVAVQPTTKYVCFILSQSFLFILAQGYSSRYLSSSRAAFLRSPNACSPSESYHSWLATEACAFHLASPSFGPLTSN